MSTKKVILIEDDLHLRDIYSRVLRNSGYIVLTAEDGQKGIELVEKNTDSIVVLLDVMLPKINGIDVLKSLRQNKNIDATHIALFTNLGEESIIKDAFSLGANDYLMKMFYDPYQVVEYITELEKKQRNKK